MNNDLGYYYERITYMARRSSLFVNLERVARAAARAQREAEAAQRRRVRDQVRHERESLRLRQQQSKWQREEYLAARQVEAAKQNLELEVHAESLRRLLAARQNPDQNTVFRVILPKFDPPVLTLPAELANPMPAPVRSTYIAAVKPRVWWEKLFHLQQRHTRDVATAEQSFQQAMQQHAAGEALRTSKLDSLRQDHDRRLTAYQGEHEKQRRQVEEFGSRVQAGDPDEVPTYFAVILDGSPYPDDFPQQFRIAYDQAAKHLVIDYELPTVGIIPTTAEYRFVKTKDTIEEKPRKAAEVKELYRDVVAATALRCLHECFAADPASLVDVLTFNGFVNTIDPATGNQIRPYVISVVGQFEKSAS